MIARAKRKVPLSPYTYLYVFAEYIIFPNGSDEVEFSLLFCRHFLHH